MSVTSSYDRNYSLQLAFSCMTLYITLYLIVCQLESRVLTSEAIRFASRDWVNCMTSSARSSLNRLYTGFTLISMLRRYKVYAFKVHFTYTKVANYSPCYVVYICLFCMICIAFDDITSTMALALAAFTDKIHAGILDPTGVVSNFCSGAMDGVTLGFSFM